jgi:hypothetical protein
LLTNTSVKVLIVAVQPQYRYGSGTGMCHITDMKYQMIFYFLFAGLLINENLKG